MVYQSNMQTITPPFKNRITTTIIFKWTKADLSINSTTSVFPQQSISSNKTDLHTKIGDLCRGGPKGSLLNSYHTMVEERVLLHSLDHFTLDSYLIMLSVKQSGIKSHFLSLWYDQTLDWNTVSQTIGEHSTH